MHVLICTHVWEKLEYPTEFMWDQQEHLCNLTFDMLTLCLDRIDSCSLSESHNASPDPRHTTHSSTSNLVFVLLVVSTVYRRMSQWPHAYSRLRDSWHCQEDHPKHPDSFSLLFSQQSLWNLQVCISASWRPSPSLSNPLHHYSTQCQKNEVSDLEHWLST